MVIIQGYALVWDDFAKLHLAAIYTRTDESNASEVA